ncbi:MAG TPA: alpha/beta hydrolase [Vicinamibacterales bacterium]|nr:alpha/beta hydrolase [Vicinamibacterales bacterium]
MRRLVFGVAFALLAVMPAARSQNLAVVRPQDDFRTVNGLRLHFVAWTADTVAERPTIVLLHGIARHAHTFDHIAPQLLRTHQVIALDMRGHGDSAWSPDGAYLVDDYVKDLEGLLDQLRLRRVSLLGNSTGGRVAQVYAGRHPDRVDRLVVEDVGPERPQNIADAFARRVEQERNGWATEDELVAQLVAQNRRTPEPLLRTYAHFGLKTRDDGRLIWKRDPNLVKGFIETELWDDVRRITSPTLYVIGGASRIVPPETQALLKQRLPNVRIVVMPGLGHYPDEEDTTGFMKIVEEFLQ